MAALPILLLAWVLVSMPAWAQTPADGAAETPSGEFGELVEVSEVLLDVLVTDPDGNIVVDLGPEDFTVVEDGQERKVTGASFYSNRFLVDEGERRGRLLHPNTEEVLADRYFILFFQDQRRLGSTGLGLYRQQLEAAQQASRWVEKEMLGGDWVAVVSFDVKLKVQADFTQDRGRLLEAIKNAAKSKEMSNQWKSRRPDGGDAPSLLAHLPAGKELRKESTRMYDAMSLVAEATRDIVGRKNMLLFTIGFGEIQPIPGASVSSGVAFSRPDRRFYPGLIESLNDNNVAVYPIDLTPTEFEHAQRDFLNVLAVDSGGFYHDHFVNFMTPIKQVADELNGYYLLSYEAQFESGERGYRKIEIDVDNPKLRVRSRQGYRFGA